ncbi:tyrosine-protein phosphatase [Cryobacterium sp. Y57]|uniref:tyrosine-protein phosphatase n=1 Tax=Cryobacterium sp. Y57 TaxID=2048287 RepID=UPI000CE2D9F5|nr:tyrosine-protein phosphatase [Cryobacterium sp. Y57]
MTLIQPLHNFRDAGTLETPSGELRPGMLMRSAAPLGLLTDIQDFLTIRGIEVIIDLRDEGERSHAPWTGSAARILSMPVFAGELRTLRFDSLEQLYEIMLDRFAPALVAAVGAVADNSNVPLLVHCTAGKDRTGVVVALVQEALGVDRHAVLAHYAVSQDVLGEDYLRDLFRGIDPADLPGADAHRAISSPPTLLATLLAAVDREYGGVEQLLLTHGLTAQQLTRLRGAYIA